MVIAFDYLNIYFETLIVYKVLKTSVLLIVIAFTLILCGENALASTTWTGGTSTDWSVSGNWSAGIPTSGVDVIIPTTVRLPTVTATSACNSITVTGVSTITLSAALTVTNGLTINSNSNFQFAGTNTVTFGAASSAANPSVFTIGSSCTVVFNGAMAFGPSATLTNNGNLKSNSATGISTSNPGSITNSSTGIITLTGSLLNITGNGTLSNSGQIIANSTSTISTGNPVTFSNTSTGSIKLTASTLNFGGATTVNNAGSIIANSSSSIIGNNPVPIANTGSISLSTSTMTLNGGSNITNTGTASVSLLSGSTATLKNPSFINNNSSGSNLTITGSTIDVQAGASITNSGAIAVSATSTFKLNGNTAPLTNNVSSTFTAANSAFIMVAGSSITNTGATMSLTSCTMACSGNATVITNQNSGATVGNFTIDNTAFTFTGTNSIVNSGTFTAQNGSSINMTSASASSAITNTGTFYAGLSNSSCIITLDGNQPKLNNNVGTANGTFYLGSTSIIYPTSTSCVMTNSTNCKFTLQSDQYGSAAIGSVPVGANPSPSLVGTYNVERYFQGGTTYDAVKKRWVERNYRVISSAVNTGTPSGGNNIYALNYIVGATAGQTTAANSATNSFITGAIGGSTSAGNPSTYLYRENRAFSNASFTSGNFIGITNIASPTAIGTSDPGTYTIPVGNGVLFFFRGAATNWASRTTAPFIAPENVTLTATGTLNQGSITVKNWYTPSSGNLGYTTASGNSTANRGFNMVGNPYACTINWDKVNTGGITATNIGPSIYVLNPVTNQYDTFSSSTHVGNPVTFTGDIASGQGFFVSALTSGAVLTFNETAKAPTNQPTGTNLLMGAPIQQEVAKLMRLKLFADSSNYDDILIAFKSSANTKYNGMEDARDLGGMGAIEGLSSFSSDGVPLAINSVPYPKKAPMVIKLSVQTTASRQLTLKRIALDSLPKIYEVWLIDKFAKDSLDLRNNSSYVFNVDLSDSTTYGNNRFSIVIRQNKALGVHLLDFTATKATDGSLISWKTENEEKYTNFSVERSTDNGVTYDVLGGFLSAAQGNYNFTDKNPAKGADMYRLKIEDLNGTISHSQNILLTYGSSAQAVVSSNINVYPNPTSGTINLAIKPDTRANLLSGVQSINKNPSLAASSQSYAIKIVNVTGSVVKSANSSQPSWQDDVGGLQPGTYIIQVVNNNDKTVVGKTTFVKM